MQNLKIGQKFYYTGDYANSADFGEIVGIKPATKYSHLTYVVKMEDSGKTRDIEAFNFSKGPGSRFELIEAYNERRERQMAAMMERIKNRQTA